MECPQCGNENPEGSEFCSLCYEKLPQAGAAGQPSAQDLPARSSHYRSPGEWHGDLAEQEIAEPEVKRRVLRFRIRHVVIVFLVLALVVGVVLMLTVWGNPSPGKILEDYLAAVTAGEEARAMELVVPAQSLRSLTRVDEDIAALGGAKLEGLKVRELRTDQDEVRVTIVGGSLTPVGGARIELTESDGLVFRLLMRKGRWYVDPDTPVEFPQS